MSAGVIGVILGLVLGGAAGYVLGVNVGVEAFKRILRLFESVDREIATWASGGITTGQLQQKLFDTTGIDLQLDGIDFRKETA